MRRIVLCSVLLEVSCKHIGAEAQWLGLGDDLLVHAGLGAAHDHVVLLRVDLGVEARVTHNCHMYIHTYMSGSVYHFACVSPHMSRCVRHFACTHVFRLLWFRHLVDLGVEACDTRTTVICIHTYIHTCQALRIISFHYMQTGQVSYVTLHACTHVQNAVLLTHTHVNNIHTPGHNMFYITSVGPYHTYTLKTHIHSIKSPCKYDEYMYVCMEFLFSIQTI